MCAISASVGPLFARVGEPTSSAAAVIKAILAVISSSRLCLARLDAAVCWRFPARLDRCHESASPSRLRRLLPLSHPCRRRAFGGGAGDDPDRRYGAGAHRLHARDLGEPEQREPELA